MSRLTYVADPMCSWCWGFAPQLEEIRRALPPEVEVRTRMGGLAPDSDEPMPQEVRAYVQGAWSTVAERTGARFDWSFWERNTPRRSTYPACRAVLAAAAQDPRAGDAMFARIQRAYYLEGRNPSDLATLDALALDLPPLDPVFDPIFDPARFRVDLRSPAIDARLRDDLAEVARLGVSGFPTLVLEHGDARTTVCRGYARAADVLAAIDALRSAPG